MKHAWSALLAAAAATATATACGVRDEALGGTMPRPDVIDSGADDPSATSINTSGKGAGTGANTGLPCEVQQVLENRCVGCHMNASPPPLLDYTDLTAKSPTNPQQSMAQRALERMKSTTSPMPPSPAVPPTADEIAAFETWVNAGTPKGAACTTPPPASGPNPYATASTCTSGAHWGGGGEGSSRMDPGRACITCHTMRGGPGFAIAGTVYPTAHEPNDCNGAAGITVVVTGSDGKVLTLTANSAGNFSSRGPVAPPFTVKVTSGGKERAMAGTLTAGDCNSCHTETGANGAPGRIMAP